MIIVAFAITHNFYDMNYGLKDHSVLTFSDAIRYSQTDTEQH